MLCLSKPTARMTDTRATRRSLSWRRRPQPWRQICRAGATCRSRPVRGRRSDRLVAPWASTAATRLAIRPTLSPDRGAPALRRRGLGAAQSGLISDRPLGHQGAVCLGGVIACPTRNDWLATPRGRLGYAFDQVLPRSQTSRGHARPDDRHPQRGLDGRRRRRGRVHAQLAHQNRIPLSLSTLSSVDCGVACNALGLAFTTALSKR